QLLGQRSGSDTDSRLASAGPLENATDRAEILDRSRQVAMPWPRSCQIVEPLELVVLVDDLQSNRASQRCAVPDSRQHFNRVPLNPLSATSPISALPTSQVNIDRRRINLHARREPIDDRQQRLAVRLAGGPIA